jgi:hypothetical protein
VSDTTCPRFIARWDLDKTYLRTSFDTVRDLLRTAIERPDQKRTVPGAARVMRELGDAGGAVHILSGSPEQLRGRLIEKLRLDGVRYASLTLKPNLRNLLRLRLKAVRGQIGYKLPALLRRRCELPSQRTGSGRDEPIPEVLLGDDAEADAFVYSLYADVGAGRIDGDRLAKIMHAADAYQDDIRDAQRLAAYIEPSDFVRRILIHLDRQSSPHDFEVFGARVVPFYNYLQAAFTLYQDGMIDCRAVLSVAQDLAARHHFDGDALAQSYFDLARRGHVHMVGLEALREDYDTWVRSQRFAAASEIGDMLNRIERRAAELPPASLPERIDIDYLSLARAHNPRRH